MDKANRRRFLFLAAGWGGVIGARLPEALVRHAAGSETSVDRTSCLQQVTKTTWALGTDVSLSALHAEPLIAETAIHDAFAELRLVDRLMSIYRPDSQLSRLNRESKLDSPHPYLVEVLQTARAMSIRSGGAFDVTVQPLWKAFADAQAAGRLPDAAVVRRARQRVDWRSVEILPERIRLLGNKTAITLNGIAQGFAADRAATALRSGGVHHALINTGEVAALGAKRCDAPWTVGIQHPRSEDAYVSLAKLAGRSLATSGDYATTFSGDYQHHHLFDPRTGRSPTALSSVSVVAATAVQADALSTAVFVLGPERGMAFLRQVPGADALLVKQDGTLLISNGFPRGAA